MYRLHRRNLMEAIMRDDQSTSDQEQGFAKIGREITVAAREQGDDPQENFRLREALEDAHQVNMPEAMIERARRQGTGEIDGPTYAERTVEGYGPHGVAVFVETISEDPSCAVSRISELFEAHGGNLGEDGCVSWQFDRRGLVEVAATGVDDADDFLLEVIEMGGEELEAPMFEHDDNPTYRVYCEPAEVRELDAAMKAASFPVVKSAIVREASQRVPLEPADAREFLSFFEKLLAHPDVRRAYANWTFA